MNYIKTTQSPLFSLLYALPLMLSYEISIFIINKSDVNGIRNSADILLKRLLGNLGFQGFQATLILILIAFIFVTIIHKIYYDKEEFRFTYYPVLLLESAIYGLAMVLFFKYLLTNQMQIVVSTVRNEHIVYSLGAGFYEELVFRAILLQGLYELVKKISFVESGSSWFITVIISSLIFVGIHYIGEFGDTFTFTSFGIRFLGSLILSTVYVFRGFAATAYSHTFYDIFVLSF